MMICKNIAAHSGSHLFLMYFQEIIILQDLSSLAWHTVCSIILKKDKKKCKNVN